MRDARISLGKGNKIDFTSGLEWRELETEGIRYWGSGENSERNHWNWGTFLELGGNLVQ